MAAPHTAARRTKTSKVWEHFSLDTAIKRITCKVCKADLAYHGSTSVMHEHLKRKHLGHLNETESESDSKCSPSGVRRTRGRIKNEQESVAVSATGKKDRGQQTELGGPTHGCTPAEEPAPSTGKGGAPVDGLPGAGPGTQRQPLYMRGMYMSNLGQLASHLASNGAPALPAADGSTLLVVVPGEAPSSHAASQAEVVVDLEEDGETTSVSSEGALEDEAPPRPARPRASTSALTGDSRYLRKRPHKSATAALDALYLRSLERDLAYKDLKIEYLKLKIKKLKQEVGTGNDCD